jgi:hypothetical protein
MRREQPHPAEMTRKVLLSRHPSLKRSGFRPSSPYDANYNCIALAAGETHQPWWPGQYPDYHWPDPDADESIETFVEAFENMGFVTCDNSAPEYGFQKVALYAVTHPDGWKQPRHMAVQLRDGEWKSKLGKDKDIIHKRLAHLEDNTLHSWSYGKVVVILKKQLPKEHLAKNQYPQARR